MGRLVSAGCLVRDQIDLFTPPTSINRVVGEVPSQLVLTVFANNGVLAWPLVDGTNTPDSSISAGSVHFNEIVGAPGYYSLRFFPDRTGFWRLVVREQALGEEIIKEFDVVPAGFFNSGSSPNGLNATFIP